MVRSSKPRKQRKAAFNTPFHVTRKRVRSRLITDDPNLVGIRSVTIRSGDTVEIHRGDFGSPNSVKDSTRGKRQGEKRGKSGVKAKVIHVDANGMLLVEGVSNTKADNKASEGIPIHPSNVVVVKVDESDPLRIKKLHARARGETE
jgi:large subunit ribosomal protein L24